MVISNIGLNFIKGYEKLKLNAYQDAVGVWTIGYGHTGYVKFFKKNVCKGMVINEAQALELLRDDCDKFEAHVNRSIKVPLNQPQFDALVSLCFNCGTILPSSTLGKLLNAGDYKGAANQFVYKDASGWHGWVFGKVNGKRTVLLGLVRRRQEEQAMFNSIHAGNTTTDKVLKTNIEAVQKYLNSTYAYGFDLLKVDGIYGAKTKTLLCIALQIELNKYNPDLVIDGAYGIKTHRAVKAVGIGSPHKNLVKLVECALFVLGYNPQEFTGVFNEDVKQAVKEFQRDGGYTVDGWFGKQCWSGVLSGGKIYGMD